MHRIVPLVPEELRMFEFNSVPLSVEDPGR